MGKMYTIKRVLTIPALLVSCSLLSEAIRNHIAGKALDGCMGQGRNSIFLAQQGGRSQDLIFRVRA
jgi:hypothetical protein